MSSLRNAIADHALPSRIKSKSKLLAEAFMASRMTALQSSAMAEMVDKVKLAEESGSLPTLTTPRHKSNDELLNDSKKMISKLKSNISKDITSLACEQRAAEPPETPPVQPPAPKSPRMRLPIAIPEPEHSGGVTEFTFKVPISPRRPLA